VMCCDLEQAALIGLLKAMRKHPESSGPGFEWYMRKRVTGAVIDELRKQDWSPRRGRRSDQVKIVRFDDMRGGSGEDGETLPCQFATSEESPEAAAIRSLDTAKAWRAPMQDADRRMARLSLVHGHPQRDIAAAEGVSEPRVSQRTLRALVAMKSYLTGDEPEGFVTRKTRQALARERYR